MTPVATGPAGPTPAEELGRGSFRDAFAVPRTAGTEAIGQRVMELATGTIKRVHLELGGKAPFLVFDDADLDAAANGAIAGALINTGQDCTAATRAYVQRPHFDAFVEKVAALMDTVRLYNTFPAEDDAYYAEAVRIAWQSFCAAKEQPNG